jgi:Family of unknown function (DUF6186)
MSARLVTLAGFTLLAAAVAAWSAVSTRRPSLVTLPTLLTRITSSRVLRLLLVIAWAWLGWHLFARGSGAFE